MVKVTGKGFVCAWFAPKRAMVGGNKIRAPKTRRARGGAGGGEPGVVAKARGGGARGVKGREWGKGRARVLCGRGWRQGAGWLAEKKYGHQKPAAREAGRGGGSRAWSRRGGGGALSCDFGCSRRGRRRGPRAS